MNSPQLTTHQHYTAADYAAWNDGQRYELLHGSIHAMSPAPNSKHQATSGNLNWQIRSFLKPKAKCQIFYAPIDVYLSDDTVVQPDIIVVCDPKKIVKKGCVGAPDLVIEILSPSTAKTDWRDKYKLYEETGVREYWIVNPDENLLHAFRLIDGKFQLHGTFSSEDTISIGIFEDVSIDLSHVFEPIDPEEA
ncbi:hypothetical protein U14_00329 [Candidatus Moduliflexus flocculans]|uniref:Putative restriction endonuclease domain-containing protein n=1 Tax=Candidatus Moduliflexus flocculans TaxID=1499966 RepID=A0A0S6VQ52_9BACT|nr:hypothetical protein U14_00329 [Candidatus Moduliflexus flocculans]